MSFLKFRGESGDDRGQLYWSRASQDGLPFRGPAAPLLRDAEFEEYTERVEDVKIATFDTSQPYQRLPQGAPKPRTYQEVLDGILSGWFKVLSRKHKWVDVDGKPVMFVYIEWSEPVLELDMARVMSAQGGVAGGRNSNSFG